MTATATPPVAADAAVRTPDLLDLLAHTARYEWPVLPEGRVWGWRSTRPDLRSRRGYRWPWPGGEAVAPDDGRDLTPEADPAEACPSSILGGLCLARTWRGASSGGATAAVALLVHYDPADVLGEDDAKRRVRACVVADVVDLTALNLREADLRGANLSTDDAEIPGWAVANGRLERA